MVYKLYKQFIIVWLTGFPSLVALFFLMNPGSLTVIHSHGLHELGVFLAEVFSAFICYVGVKSFKRRKALTIAYVTLAYAGFTFLYAYHGLFTFADQTDRPLFLIFGPMARLVMSVYLLAALGHVGEYKEQFYWRWHLAVILSAATAAFLAVKFVNIGIIHIKLMEFLALTLFAITVAKLIRLQNKTILVRYHLIAQLLFAQASGIFLLAAPWDTLWWFAHVVSATGFLVLGFAVVRLYERTHTISTVYDAIVVEHLLDKIVDASPVGILLVDFDLKPVRWNAETERLLPMAEVLPLHEEIRSFIQRERVRIDSLPLHAGFVKGILELYQEFQPICLEIRACKLNDNSAEGYLITLIDVTERQQAAERIRHSLRHDVLTGLPNRMYFAEYIGAIIQEARETAGAAAVMFIDMDGFKAINDTLGHAAGDAALKEIAGQIQYSLRPGDFAARIGGDEFTAILPGISTPSEAVQVAENILRTLQTPLEISGKTFHLSASIGISLYPADGDNPDDIVNKADSAMYRIKRVGKNGYQFYHELSDENFL